MWNLLLGLQAEKFVKHIWLYALRCLSDIKDTSPGLAPRLLLRLALRFRLRVLPEEGPDPSLRRRGGLFRRRIARALHLVFCRRPG